jgi:membrane-associated phospholipid phosphatase
MESLSPPQSPRSSARRGAFWALVRGRALLIAIVLMTALFVLLTALILRADLKPTDWDVGITHEMQEFPRFPVGELLVAISWPGFRWQNWVIPAVVIAFMLWRRWYTEGIFTLLATLGGFSSEIVKNIVDRPRPDQVYSANVAVSVASGYSFPSGHVTSYVTLYGCLFYLAFTLLSRRSFARWVILVVCGALVVLVGPSRVYMGQHWASDALAGYALGFAYLLLVIALYRFWLRRHPKASAAEDPVSNSGPG